MSDFNRQWKTRFGWPVSQSDEAFAIAHRGASGHRTENSMPAFRLASDLASEMWELDVRMSSDGVAVVSHDDNLARITGRGIRISESNWDEIRLVRMPDGSHVPSFAEVLELAMERGTGLYVEAKSEGSAEAAWRILEESGYKFATIGSFNVGWITALRQAGCPYPLSVLVPSGADPFAYSQGAEPDIIHLCWRDASDEPDKLIDDALVARCHSASAAIVTWHEDRRNVLDGLAKFPILGICSDRPEVLKPYVFEKGASAEIVCHRGANIIAPENTREAARICIDQNFQYVEIDVRTTVDGQLVVLHDATVDRTTDGQGNVSRLTLDEVKRLDAGRWKSPVYTGFKVPTLEEILDLCRGRIGVYIEIKDAESAEVVQCVLDRGMLDSVFFWSWDREVMHEIRSAHPDARLMATRARYATLEQTISDYGANIVEYEFGRDDLTELAECKDRDVATMIFSLSHAHADIAQILAAQPDLVNLDRPDLFKIHACYRGSIFMDQMD